MIARMLILIVMISFGSFKSVIAHSMEGEVFSVMRWHDYDAPAIDRDTCGRSWEWFSDHYWIPFSVHRGLQVSYPDSNDYNSEIMVSWNEIENKIYLFERRHDDAYVTLNQEGMIPDRFSIGFDGDHGGEAIWFDDDAYEEEERALNMGRWAQHYSAPLPFSPAVDTLGTWAHLWMSQATWYYDVQYMDMAWKYDEEGNLCIESSWTLWDDFIWNDQEASVQTDLEGGNIIHISWIHEDQDSDEDDQSANYWYFGELDSWRTSSSHVDFILESEYGYDPIADVFPSPDDSGIGAVTWGRIKSSIEKNATERGAQ